MFIPWTYVPSVIIRKATVIKVTQNYNIVKQEQNTRQRRWILLMKTKYVVACTPLTQASILAMQLRLNFLTVAHIVQVAQLMPFKWAGLCGQS